MILLLLGIALFFLLAWIKYDVALIIYIIFVSNLGLMSDRISLKTPDMTSMAEGRDLLFIILVLIGFLRSYKLLPKALECSIIKLSSAILIFIPTSLLMGYINGAGNIEILREMAILSLFILPLVLYINLDYKSAKMVLFTSIGIGVLISIGHIIEFYSLNKIRVVTSITSGPENLMRQLPDGSHLVMFAFICSFSLYFGNYVNSKIKNIWLIISMILSGLSIAMMQVRGMILSIFMTIILYLFISSFLGIGKGMLKKILFLFILVGIIIMILFYITERFDPFFLEKAWNRIIFPIKVMSFEIADAGRAMELKEGIRALYKNPVFGVGLGGKYYEEIWFPTDLRNWSHNGYLWYALKLGLIGFIVLISLLFRISKMIIQSWINGETYYINKLCSGVGMWLCTEMIYNNTSASIASIHGLPIFLLMVAIFLKLKKCRIIDLTKIK